MEFRSNRSEYMAMDLRLLTLSLVWDVEYWQKAHVIIIVLIIYYIMIGKSHQQIYPDTMPQIQTISTNLHPPLLCKRYTLLFAIRYFLFSDVENMKKWDVTKHYLCVHNIQARQIPQ